MAYAAERYGVQAVGITISKEQAAWGRQRIAEMGLSDRCRIELRDYRAMEEPEAFDKIVSVGMFEHVGKAKLPVYFERAYRLLRPGGLFLNHGIASMYPPEPGLVGGLVQRALMSRGGFIDRYVFPDGELVPVSYTATVAERVGFEVRDVEGLREHYALTLRRWLRGIETRREEALQIVDEPTYLVRRLYMAGCVHSFETAKISVYQTLLVKPDSQGESGLPLTRAHLYR